MAEPLLSLCMIVGREKEYLARCLDSFAGLYDELCIVFARGSGEDDGTEAIAAQYGAKTARYLNRHETRTWPHVDDFSAARNVAWGLGTGKYLMWADADDLITPENKAKLRALVEQADVDVMHVAYNTGNGNFLLRPRIVRRGKGVWIHAIHETIACAEGFTHSEHWDTWFDHAPLKLKETSLDRNLRMLTHHVQQSPRHLYYLQQDYFLSQQYERAIPYARAALEMTELARDERYEIHTNLGTMLADPYEKRLEFLKAVGVHPGRREAFVQLALLECEKRNFRDALDYSRVFSAIPRPSPQPWNHKEAMYDWFGAHVAIHCMRLNGMEAAARDNERRLFEAGGRKFSLLHPTRGRAQQAKATLSEWLMTATDPKCVEHIFGIDADDEESRKALAGYRHVVSQTPTCVAATNLAAAEAEGSVLVYISDDIHPFKGWDVALWDKIKDRLHEPLVVRVSDGRRTDGLMTVNVCTRARWLQQGYFFHPDYESMYADTDWTAQAIKDQCIVEAWDIVFRHDNPFFATGRVDTDATYARQNAPERYERGKATFQKRHPEMALA